MPKLQNRRTQSSTFHATCVQYVTAFLVILYLQIRAYIIIHIYIYRTDLLICSRCFGATRYVQQIYHSTKFNLLVDELENDCTGTRLIMQLRTESDEERHAQMWVRAFKSEWAMDEPGGPA